ncbi:universal stress protein [Geodermatophilus sp. SYSU D01176]
MTEQSDEEWDEGGTRVADGPGEVLVGHDGSRCAQEALPSAARAGSAGLVLGSVSDRGVRHAPCPVAVVRSGAGSASAPSRAR